MMKQLKRKFNQMKFNLIDSLARVLARKVQETALKGPKWDQLNQNQIKKELWNLKESVGK